MTTFYDWLARDTDNIIVGALEFVLSRPMGICTVKDWVALDMTRISSLVLNTRKGHRLIRELHLNTKANVLSFRWLQFRVNKLCRLEIEILCL